MKQALFVILMLTLFVSLPAYAQPKIQIKEGLKLDFGDLYNAEKLSHDVMVLNTGKDTLRVKDVRAQCGCTATLLAKKIIAPNDSEKLTITFNPYGYADGKVTKHVYIQSNDPKDSMLTIEFLVNVTSVLTLEPSMFSFANAKIDTTYTAKVIIKNVSKENVKITSVKSSLDLLTVTFKKNSLKPTEEVELEGTFRTAKSGTFSGTVDITTDSPILPKTTVRIFAWVTRK